MAQVVAFNAALTRIGFNAQAVASLNANGLTLVPDLINLNEKDIAQVLKIVRAGPTARTSSAISSTEEVRNILFLGLKAKQIE
jgi:hypothetical protein